MLAEKLNMPPEDAERWIVDLIRHSPLDAKIDSKLVSFETALAAFLPNRAMFCSGKIISNLQ